MAVLILIAVCAGGSRANALTIIPTFADSFTNYPSTAATIKATIYSAIAEYEAAILDPIQIEIIFTLHNGSLGASGTFGFDTDYSFMLWEIAGDEAYYQSISRTGTSVDYGVIPIRDKDPRKESE